MSRVLLLLSLVSAPALAEAPPRGEPLSLVDGSFAAPAQAPLVSAAPVSDAPAVPPGTSLPDNDITLLWILLGAAGGAVVGFFAGIACCYLIYWY
ncbi:MAG: hypothetical protein H6741_16645 [Alphaproteobacteria bacterium]|nr:hypothetical protein [Alphaproteobacteria bacterium]MCB9794344.1 hypothetical protein [Alphaproteobacteria bacterium]